MTPFTLRPALDTDAEEMTIIAAGNPTAPRWTATQLRETLVPRAEGGTICRSVLVAEQAGRVIGFAVASALCTVYPVEAELESLAVDPALHGRGIGRSLLAATLEWASGQNAESIRLEVRTSSQRALHIYEQAGFRLTGRRPGYYAAPVEDAVVMERILRPFR